MRNKLLTKLLLASTLALSLLSLPALAIYPIYKCTTTTVTTSDGYSWSRSTCWVDGFGGGAGGGSGEPDNGFNGGGSSGGSSPPHQNLIVMETQF